MPERTALTRGKEIRNQEVIGAIRLALVGASHDDARAVRTIAALCGYAPETPDSLTGPVELLRDAIRQVEGV